MHIKTLLKLSKNQVRSIKFCSFVFFVCLVFNEKCEVEWASIEVGGEGIKGPIIDRNGCMV